jgi:heat shock protein HslJ
MKTKWVVLCSLLCLSAGLLIACKPLWGTDWTLVSLNGHELIPGTNITATFKENYIAGHAGCNLYSSEIEIDDVSLILVGDLPITDMLCLDPEGRIEQEREYLDTLKTITTYVRAGEQLDMKNEAGEMVLTFQKGLP